MSGRVEAGQSDRTEEEEDKSALTQDGKFEIKNKTWSNANNLNPSKIPHLRRSSARLKMLLQLFTTPFH